MRCCFYKRLPLKQCNVAENIPRHLRWSRWHILTRNDSSLSLNTKIQFHAHEKKRASKMIRREIAEKRVNIFFLQGKISEKTSREKGRKERRSVVRNCGASVPVRAALAAASRRTRSATFTSMRLLFVYIEGRVCIRARICVRSRDAAARNNVVPRRMTWQHINYCELR